MDLSSHDEGTESFRLINEDDREMLRRTTRALGLTKSYVEDWTTRDAFRELYQNWKDAIIVTFQLDQRSFTPTYEDGENDILITVKNPRSTNENPLGFIRYQKDVGILELTNFQARLTARNLELGGTTKRNNKNVAGAHGEGFKVAALVMHRGGYSVRFAASSFNWNFYFRGQTKSNFYCRLTPVAPKKLQKEKEAYLARTSKDLTANVWEDVSVFIGEKRDDGQNAVSTEVFLSWLQVTIDINSPPDTIRTECGDLILDPAYAGKIYLKGLLLSKANTRAREFKFGYNLFHGRINRDRQRLTDPSEEAQILKSIWEQAINLRGDMVLDNYIQLLRDEPNCADIHLAESKINKNIAEKIWARLLSRSAKTGFYYSDKFDHRDPETIMRCLKKEPLQLSEVLWKLLRRFSLIRTPQEHRIHMFQRCQLATVQMTSFAQSIRRALQASLALDAVTQDISLCFVTGENAGVELLFEPEDKILRIHEDWLDFDKTHNDARCEISKLVTFDIRSHGPYIFSCDHIVEELYELALRDVIKCADLSHLESIAIERRLRYAVRNKLRQMPRMIKVRNTIEYGELEVSWTDGESRLISKICGSSLKNHIILHREEACSPKRFELLHLDEANLLSPLNESCSKLEIQTIARCGCFQIVTLQATEKVIFRGLNPSQAYFPMMARTGDQTFFGFAPAPTTPAAADTVPRASVADRSSVGDKVNSQAPCSGSLSLGAECSPVSDRTHTHNSTYIGESSSMLVDIPPGRGETSNVEHLTQQHEERKLRNKRMWKSWHKRMFPAAFNRFVSPRVVEKNIPLCTSIFSHDRLKYTFANGEYVRVEVRNSNNGEVTTYILFIHEIFRTVGKDGRKSIQLSVTKYSFLAVSPCFKAYIPVGENDGIRETELLLHFSDFTSMGARQDAEVVDLDDIVTAQELDFDPMNVVEYTVGSIPDVADCSFFCRFAIQGNANPDIACLTPVSSSLLRYHDRWKIPRFLPCSPKVFDLSPAALGSAEGFAQASCDIHAGLGFDKANNMTWKVRHSSSLVYDQSTLAVLDDFVSQRLAPPLSFESEVAKVVIVSGANDNFALHDDREMKSSLHLFSEPLDILGAAVTSGALRPDFLVLTMSTALLHDLVLSKLTGTMLILLENGYSVHLRKIEISDQGVPQNRTALVLLASPFCAAPKWHLDQCRQEYRRSAEAMVTIRDAIADLSFKNSRANREGQTGFVCDFSPSTFDHSKEVDDYAIIYNHQTGLSPLYPYTPISFDSAECTISPQDVLHMTHPVRGDTLTVRELARIQGFPDDFIFYDDDLQQYKQVAEAFPPQVAKMLADTIINTIREFCVICTDEHSDETVPDGRRKKRSRKHM